MSCFIEVLERRNQCQIVFGIVQLFRDQYVYGHFHQKLHALLRMNDIHLHPQTFSIIIIACESVTTEQFEICVPWSILLRLIRAFGPVYIDCESKAESDVA